MLEGEAAARGAAPVGSSSGQQQRGGHHREQADHLDDGEAVLRQPSRPQPQQVDRRSAPPRPRRPAEPSTRAAGPAAPPRSPQTRRPGSRWSRSAGRSCATTRTGNPGPVPAPATRSGIRPRCAGRCWPARRNRRPRPARSVRPVPTATGRPAPKGCSPRRAAGSGRSPRPAPARPPARSRRSCERVLPTRAAAPRIFRRLLWHAQPPLRIRVRRRPCLQPAASRTGQQRRDGRLVALALGCGRQCPASGGPGAAASRCIMRQQRTVADR